jgi:hypothetical protein
MLWVSKNSQLTRLSINRGGVERYQGFVLASKTFPVVSDMNDFQWFYEDERQKEQTLPNWSDLNGI